MSDLIRREDAIAEVLAYLCSSPTHDEELLRWDMEQLIRALPAVQPDRIEQLEKELSTCRMAQVVMDNTVAKLNEENGRFRKVLERVASLMHDEYNPYSIEGMLGDAARAALKGETP